MNWGTKILLVFAVFVSGIVFMVFKAGTFNNDLVTNDYYEQELKYQQTIDATERTNALSGSVSISTVNQQLQIRFPQEMNNKTLEADVWLYCISDKKKDLKKQFISNEGEITMPILASNKGMHELKLNWIVEGENYYYTQKIMLP